MQAGRAGTLGSFLRLALLGKAQGSHSSGREQYILILLSPMPGVLVRVIS